MQYATAFKMGGIALLTLVLLVPVSFVESTLSERRHRRNEAVSEITATWGGSQAVIGPVLIIPYRYPVKAEKCEVVEDKRRCREVVESAVANAYFLPAELEIDGDVGPKRLARGIYEAVVYSGKLRVAGRFSSPDWRSLKVEAKDVLWSDAAVTFAIPDLRGAKGGMTLDFGGKAHHLQPGTRIPGYASGLHASVGQTLRPDLEAPFSLDVHLNGTSSLRFAPLGMRNVVTLRSPWPDPRFEGAFLPADREVSARGFRAKWEVSYYGRSYPQQSTDKSGGRPEEATLQPSLFGVAFIAPVDSYRNVERSTKYAILFISMVFCAFFLFEILSALRIHPLQYVLVGLALCLFFLVLLSLSEFVAFGLAYLAASAGTVLMIVLYSAKVLRSGGRTTMLAGELAAVYGYLYVVLQLQDYSLLMGSALLTAVLAAVMVATRNLDWYAVDAQWRSEAPSR